MAGERYTTPDEDAVVRMVRQSGTPEGAAQNLFARLEALEALAAQLQSQQDDANETVASASSEADEVQADAKPSTFV